MKASIFTFSALVAVVAAQESNSLSQCLQVCSERMMGDSKVQELGCDASGQAEEKNKCLCSKPSFLYGFRDCAAQACTQDDGKKLVDMALNICKNAGVVIATDGSSSDSSSSGSSNGGKATVTYSTYSSSGTLVSTPIATQTGAGDDGDDGDDSSSAGGAGGAVVTTITSNGSAIVSTITSMASGSSSEGASETATANASSTESDNASSSGSNGGSGASQTGNSGGASSSSSAGPAPQVTAAPATGLLAAVGIAALLL